MGEWAFSFAVVEGLSHKKVLFTEMIPNVCNIFKTAIEMFSMWSWRIEKEQKLPMSFLTEPLLTPFEKIPCSGEITTTTCLKEEGWRYVDLHYVVVRLIRVMLKCQYELTRLILQITSEQGLVCIKHMHCNISYCLPVLTVCFAESKSIWRCNRLIMFLAVRVN